MNPLVSIIIPTFNRAHFILEPLNSIIAQSFEDWECLIVDDGSDAENSEFLKNIVKKDDRLCLYSRPSEIIKGPSGCRNYGLRLAKGKYIQFFDDDDIMYPEMIKKKVEMIFDLSYDVVVAQLDYYDVSLKKIIKQNRIFSDNIIKDYILGNISWYVSGPMWKKEFLLEEFDISIQTLDDWDFNLRNIYRKPKITYLNFPLQRYNRYSPGKTLSTLGQLGNEKQIESSFLVYKKHYNLLRNQGLLNTKLHLYLFKRLVFLLRASLEKKHKISTNIYKFLQKNNRKKDEIKFIKIIVGFYSYKYFGKGYRFINF